MKVSATNDDWREIVYCALENQQIDFKSHQDWNDIGRVGRAKFARHAMALANTQGGYVVVGVTEDENGTPNVYTGMTEEEAGSFDPSTVGQTINAFADPPVSLDIVRPLIDGRRYVILVIYPFTDIPHVCSENCEHELQRGGFYIRTPDARSKLAVKASEIHPLIRRALRNQRQMLGRMLRGILYEDKQVDIASSQTALPQLENSRNLAVKYLGKRHLIGVPCYEVMVIPGTPLQDIRISDLRQAIEQMERPSISEITPGNAITTEGEIFATNDSLCGVVRVDGEPRAFWETTCSGSVYLLIPLCEADEKTVKADELSEMMFLTLEGLGELFTSLNHPDVLLSITLHIHHAEDASLIQIPFHANPRAHICRIPDIQVSCHRSPADLEGGAAAEAAVNLFSEICQRFNASLDATASQNLRKKFDTYYN